MPSKLRSGDLCGRGTGAASCDSARPIFGCLANEELCNFLVDNVVDRTLGNKYPKGSERVRNFLQAVRKKLRNFQCSSHENRQRVFGFPQ
ncbi:hypothetical protein PERCYII40_4048 [Pseudomonas aeruginosa]|nr:hypothetical protein PERCYII40_4048 [Pseudomonas aeruginosa]